jgi:hypothetical protein
MATHLPQNWIQKLCVALSVDGWQTSAYPNQVVRLFKAWAQAEGGNATWNPLNSTDHVHSAEGAWQGTDYNSVGVCNYLKPYYGIAATAGLLLGGNYDALVADLRTAATSGKTAEQIVKDNAALFTLWGTGPKLVLEVLATIT